MENRGPTSAQWAAQWLFNTCVCHIAMRTSFRELAEALPAAVSAASGSIDGRIFCVCRRTLVRRSCGRPCSAEPKRRQ